MTRKRVEQRRVNRWNASLHLVRQVTGQLTVA
jgi:hypothetical protein